MMGDRLSRLLRDAKAAETAAAFREDLDVHDAGLHDHGHDEPFPDGQSGSWTHDHEHEHDGGRHRHLHEHANPFRSGDGGYIADRIDREWTPVLQDLLELEAAGALGGIRAIIAERLRQVRSGAPYGLGIPVAIAVGAAGDPAASATAAALLAAEIDRQQPGGGS